MATLAQHSDSSAGAFARAGESMLRRWANAEATVLDYAFGVCKSDVPTVPALGGAAARSTQAQIDALASDVAAAPVDLYEQSRITVDGVAYTIVDRIDRTSLGQVTFYLEPAA